jgi:hypothetical protein
LRVPERCFRSARATPGWIALLSSSVEEWIQSVISVHRHSGNRIVDLEYEMDLRGVAREIVL